METTRQHGSGRLTGCRHTVVSRDYVDQLAGEGLHLHVRVVFSAETNRVHQHEERGRDGGRERDKEGGGREREKINECLT